MTTPYALLLFSLLFACSPSEPFTEPFLDESSSEELFLAESSVNEPINKSISEHFLRRSGNEIVLGDTGVPVSLKGINFNNYHWYRTAEDIITSKHHSHLDYQRVSDMGMNLVRFQLNHKSFSNDKVWGWIDKNIEWARENNIYLILDMHVPPGGQQSGLEDGVALWTIPANQEKLTELWKKIALEYRNEPVIAGFSLLNEPVPVDSIEQWPNLANSIISEIRKIDQNHMIVFEWPLGLYGNGESYNDRDLVQMLVDDQNVLYDMHFMHPFEFTHQNAFWLDMGDGGKYPDEEIVMLPEDLVWSDSTLNNPIMDANHAEWRLYDGAPMENLEIGNLIAIPVMISSNNAEEVSFRDVFIREFDENMALVREIPIRFDSSDAWDSWTSSGNDSSRVRVDEQSQILSISNTNGQVVFYDFAQYIEVKREHFYSIGGLIKGKLSGEESYSQIRLDFYKSESGSSIMHRGKEEIEKTLQYWIKFAEDKQIPLIIGEFGTHYSTFVNNKGGLDWVRDAVTLFEENNLNYAYYDYHSYESMGIYSNAFGLPDEATANHSLIEFFSSHLK